MSDNSITSIPTSGDSSNAISAVNSLISGVENKVNEFKSVPTNFRMTIISIVIVVCLFVVIGFMWHMYDSKSKEVVALKSQVELSKSISETNAKLDEMNSREKDVYPQLLDTKNKLIENNARLADMQNKLQIIGKGKIDAEVSKMDLRALSDYLNAHGYPNSIISSGK